MSKRLSSSQTGVYLECLSDPCSTHYNIPYLGRFTEKIDVERLKTALSVAIAAHPALSAVIRENADGSVYLSPSGTNPEVYVYDLTEKEFAARRKNLVRPFNLVGGALSRFEIYRTESNVYLFEDVHHLIFDGTSVSVLAADVRRAFFGMPIEKEKCSIFDEAEYESGLLKTERAKIAEEYWKDILTGAEPDCLPESDAVDTQKKQGWLTKEIDIDEKTFAEMRKKKGFSTSAFFTAAFSYALSVFTGSDDVLFNTITSGRDERNDNVVGMYVSTFPYRVKFGENESVENCLKKATETLLEGKKNSFYPYIYLAEKYGLKPSVEFAYQRDLSQNAMVDGFGTEVERILDDAHIEAAALHAELARPVLGRYSLLLGYRADIFSREFAESFAETYFKIVREFFVALNLGDVNLVSDDINRRLDAFNLTEVKRDGKDIISSFRETVKKFKDKTALVSGDKRYSYGELDAESDALAVELNKRGIGKGAVVSVLVPRNEYMAIASLGILKSGAAYQPLDPAYPEERLKFMVENASAVLVIADRELAVKLKDTDVPLLFTDEIPALPYRKPADARISLDDTFVLLYTSGTTGTPKGAIITHGNVAELSAWSHDYFKMDENVNYGAYASYGFDAHMAEIYPTLTCGGTLFIIPDDIRLDLIAVEDFYNANKITHGQMTTQVGRQFAMHYKGGTLKALMVGGEVLVPIDPKDVRFTLYNAYGPSECTVLCAIQPVDRLYRRIPIGKALDNVKIYVADKKLRRLPPFAPGELLIAGPRVAKGYLGLPEKTAASFIKNPFSEETGYLRAYRSGDVVRLLSDGRLDFIGRNDGQVKVRGFRIELSEVEAVIREFNGITDATVQAFADEHTGMKYLAAYVVSDGKIDVNELNEFIRKKKPPYMVPAVTMQIDAIPLTANQKVNKRALPLPKRERSERVMPKTDAEKKVFECACEALGHADLGITDDLYEAGLSSINVMRLIVLLSDAFGKTVRMGDVKANPTVKKLAEFVIGVSGAVKKKTEKTYPLSGVQQGVYVECMANPDTTVYNIPLLLKLDGEVDIGKLESALKTTVDAHPYLKTKLVPAANGEIRAVRDDAKEIKIARLTKSELKDGFSSLVKPFDLLKDDLVRIATVSDGEDKYLFMDTHHLVFDGESLLIFLRDLNAAYGGKTLDCETYTGFDVAVEEEERKNSDEYENAEKYYEKLLDGIDTECMPVRDRDEKSLSAAEFSLEVRTDREKLLNLNAFGGTLNGAWNAAFGFALSKFLARDNCVFTTVYNGRNDPRVLNCVGMFVHTLPVVCKFEKGETGRDAVRRISRQISDSMANDVYPFSEISRNLDVKANILFVYEGKIGSEFTIGGKTAKDMRLKPDALKADLTFFVFETENGFRIDCDYNARYYEEWNVRSLTESVATAFVKLLEDEKLENVTLFSGENKAKTDVTQSSESEVEDTDIVTLFSRAAKKYPENTAVIFGGKRISYRELDAVTDKIAARIQSLGIGKEDIVSVLVRRGENMPVAALGVLKSGAAYQPLDPAYPAERLNFMVKNAGVKLVIADGELAELLSEYNGEWLFTENIASLPNRKPKDANLKGDNLFIVLYTSGTTGTPKGVMLEHGNLVNFCDWYKKHYSLLPDSVVGAYASFGFDADMMDMYPALTSGAAVYIIPEDMRLDLGALNRAFIENRVTHIFMTTQMGRMFAENMKGESLIHLSVGGETLVPIEPPTGFKLWNGYGPTECTVFSTIKEIDKRYYRNPIGKPLQNYRVYVVDANGNELPEGALGELWIAGRGVGRGYLSLPEQTAKSFIRNPFTDEKGFCRVYRTGDVVRRLPDGSIDFIGRNDGQVKIRGFRIELAEVEAVIREYDGVTDATVQAFDDTAFGGKYLAAYVVGKGKIDFSALSDFIKSKKPAYMVPAAFTQLDAIPLNQNQKVNKRALPKPVRNADSKEKSAPENELEREICEEFAKILGVDSVGATDDFFSLGGTSISAAKIVMFAMNKNYPIAYKDVFDNPTARGLARRIKEADGVSETVTVAESVFETEGALKNNVSAKVDGISSVRPLGRTLLTGGTGFLGSHVLRELLKRKTETVVLCRGNESLSAKTRLSAMTAYYFDDPLDEETEKLVKVIDGDITANDLSEKLENERIDTIINCAACVKHFAKDDVIERINLGGAKNIIAIAKEKGARLIQISTLSVAGENVDGKFPSSFRMSENMLYFGQDISNKYVNSKFRAEEEIIKAVEEEGLDAKIIRVGNLMGRQSDGEFQINSITNSFIKSLKAYKAIGLFPVSECDTTVDFSPIDEVAKAVATLAQTQRDFTVFHAANSHEVQMGDVIAAMNDYGFDIKIVPNDVFSAKLAEIMKDEKRRMLASSLLTYSSGDNHVYSIIKTDNSFTVKALYRLGYKWPITDGNYLSRVIEALDSLNYFDREDI